jgi:hypothetical protein
MCVQTPPPIVFRPADTAPLRTPRAFYDSQNFWFTLSAIWIATVVLPCMCVPCRPAPLKEGGQKKASPQQHGEDEPMYPPGMQIDKAIEKWARRN